MLDSHLHNRQPEGLATHRERTKLVYRGAAVAFGVLMLWNALVLWLLWRWWGAGDEPAAEAAASLEQAMEVMLANATAALPLE
jgi:hypothetical protein